MKIFRLLLYYLLNHQVRNITFRPLSVRHKRTKAKQSLWQKGLIVKKFLLPNACPEYDIDTVREKIIVWQTQRTHLKHHSTNKMHVHTDIKVSLWSSPGNSCHSVVRGVGDAWKSKAADVAQKARWRQRQNEAVEEWHIFLPHLCTSQTSLQCSVINYYTCKSA